MDYINKKQKWLFSIVALLVAAFHLIPFYILITTALKAKGILAQNGFSQRSGA